jgi:hypothetical protein
MISQSQFREMSYIFPSKFSSMEKQRSYPLTEANCEVKRLERMILQSMRYLQKGLYIQDKWIFCYK